MKVSILKNISNALKGKMLLLASLVFLVAFSFTIHLFAAPPTTQYVPGQTLDPNCTPGSSNCTVSVEPAVTTFDTVVSSSYTIDASGHTDQTIYADTSSGDVTITLPSLASAPTIRRTIHIIKISAANTLYVNGASGDFINFTTSIEVNTARQTITFQSLGQNQWSAVPNFDALSISPILVKAATAVALGAHTYSNGASGIGATLTGSGALPAINGISISIGERILVKNEGTCTSTQCDSIENGVYSLTSNSPWVLTRTTDSDSTSEFYPQIVIPTQGTNTIRGKQWIQQAPDPVVGTDTIAYKKTGSGTGGSGGLGDVVQGIGGTQRRGQIAFWTNNTKELSQGGAKLFWDNTNKRLGLGLNTPTATLDILGDTTGSNLLNIVGQTPTADGVVGGLVNIQTGNGADSVASSGGAGGDFLINLGQGGVSASGFSAGGGSFVFNAGLGSDGNIGGQGGGYDAGSGPGGSAAAGDGGFGGQFNIGSGHGGSSVGGNGGDAGIFSIIGGNGGAASGGGNGGKSADINISSLTGGAADLGGAAGDGGVITITGGQGGASSGGNRGNGGNIVINPGPKGLGGLGGLDGNIILANLQGRVGIGLDTPSYPLHVKGDVGGVVAKFETAGGATACTLNGTTGLLSCSSDRTLKKDIVDLDSELSNILALKPVSYRWNTDDGSAEKKFGFIAQDVESIFPSLVLTDGETGKKSLSIGGMVPFMVKAIQELNAKVDALGGGATVVVADVGGFLSDTAEKFMNGITHVAHLIVGSPDNRIGITIYDEATGEPYCIKVVNGQMQNIAGVCETVQPTPPPVETPPDPEPEPPTDDGGTGGQEIPPVSENL